MHVDTLALGHLHQSQVGAPCILTQAPPAPHQICLTLTSLHGLEHSAGPTQDTCGTLGVGAGSGCMLPVGLLTTAQGQLCYVTCLRGAPVALRSQGGR